MIEALALEEAHQVLEVLFGFAGEPHDQRGAQHRIGELVADLIQQAVVHIRLPGAVHRPQHLRMAVLQRQIQIRHHIGHLPVGRQHVWGQPGGIGVVDPDPGDLHVAKGSQQFRQLGFAVEVKAVVGGDLADQDQLLHPLFRQLVGFSHD